MDWKKLALCAGVGMMIAGCGDNSKPAPTTAATTGTAATMADDMTKAAEKLLADGAGYIKDHKWELADKAVAELDGMKAKLPAEYASKIDSLKSALATAKSAMGNMPTSMPGMPKTP